MVNSLAYLCVRDKIMKSKIKVILHKFLKIPIHPNVIVNATGIQTCSR